MAAQSKSEAVGDAIAAGIATLNLLKPGITPDTPVPIARRKTPTSPEGAANGLPEVVISIGEEGSIQKIDALTDLVKYPAAVTIVTAGGLKTADDMLIRKWRDQIRQKCQDRRIYTGVVGFNAISTVGKPPFDTSALAKDYNYSMWVFTVEVLESRVSPA